MMLIGIISAMHEEMQLLLQYLQPSTQITKGMRTYYSGKLFNVKVVLVFSRWGKVASATTATQLINDYNVDEIIFTGVAGSVNNSLNIGDVVIGNNLFQYDVDASPFYKKFELPLLNKYFFETSVSCRNQLYTSAQTFLKSFNDIVDDKKARSFHITQPKVMEGDIASGDQFISNKALVNKIKAELPSVVCVEMEGASVAQVCYEYAVPFSIIRIISDKADDNSHINFPKFAKEVASQYALAILKNYLTHADN